MKQVTFKGTPLQLEGTFPKVGDTITDLTLTSNDLKEVKLSDFKQGTLVLNIFPSLDTPVCASSVVRFNAEAADLPNTEVLCISKDLPFAQARFCATDNIQNAKILSAFRHPEFAKQLGVDIADGLLKNLLSRSIIILDSARKVIYTQLVPEITEKPNYDECLAVLKEQS